MLAAALLWGTIVVAFRTAYASKDIPIGLGYYLEHLPPDLTTLGPNFTHFWIGHLLRLAAGILFFIGAWALGRKALEWILGPAAEDAAADSIKVVFSLGLGLGMLACLAFFLAAAGLASRNWVIPCYVLVCLYGGWGVFRHWPKGNGPPRADAAARPTALERIAFAFLCLGLLYAFLGTTVPEVFYDALVYHLAVPQAYLTAGRMIDLPYNHYSYLPLLVSMLYLWALAVGGMYCAKIFSFLLGLCLLAAIYSGGKFLKDRGVGLVAAAMFLGMPLVLNLFWMSNSDLGAAFFLTLALLGFWRWRQNPQKHIRWLYLSGLCGGFALASKYTAALGVGLLALAAIWEGLRHKDSPRFSSVALYGFLILLPLVPWWVRNYAYKKNPFFPYMVNTLGGTNADPALIARWYAETRNGTPGLRPMDHLEKIWNDAVLGFKDPQYTDTGPLFVAFIFLIFAVFKIPWVRFVALYAGAAYFLGLSATYLTRLLVPYLAPLCWVLALAALSISGLKKAFRVWVGALFMAILFFNVYQLSKLDLFTSVDGLGVATGRVTPEEYLKLPRNLYPDPSYGAYEFLKGLHLRGDEKILLLGDSRAFYSPGPTIASAPYDIPPILAWAGESRTPQELWEKLKSRRLCVFLSNRDELHRTVSAKYLNPRSEKLISSMLHRHFNLAYQDHGVVVYLCKNLTAG